MIAELPCSNYMECKRMVPPCILKMNRGRCIGCTVTTAGACVTKATGSDVCSVCCETVRGVKTMPFKCTHAVCVKCTQRLWRNNVRRRKCAVCKESKGHACTAQRAGYVAFVSTAMDARGMSVDEAVCAWHEAHC
jgi:hypothetical protein